MKEIKEMKDIKEMQDIKEDHLKLMPKD